MRDYVRDGKASSLPPYVPADATPLDAVRATAMRYARLLDGLHDANGAPYTPEAGRPDPAATGRFESFVVAAAHVRFADGRRHEATTLLLDGLTMARRTDDDAAQTLVADAIRRDEDAIPLAECDRIRKAADGFLVPGLAGEPRRELALVRLRMRIEAYRWRYGKPPARLADAAPDSEALDPATHAAFPYEIAGSDYRLANQARPTP